jgi:3-hydroxymyristoyl/3-hydroxydecanoyl-(acyl carrier protein) dehydratase
MIIEEFDFQVLQGSQMIFEGQTNFGFFTKEALDRQVGLRDAAKQIYIPSGDEMQRSKSIQFKAEVPLEPGDLSVETANTTGRHELSSLAMPASALRMIDTIEVYVPDGGPLGLGFIRGIKTVDPQEWFFKAHFFQDPVCPGSLGIESFLQLIKYIAIDRWGHLTENHRFELLTQIPHNWLYRGQIIPQNKKIEVEVVVTAVQDKPVPYLQADGFLKVDGLCIYKMENFGLKIVPL